MKEIIDKVDFLKITNLLCKRQCEENEWQAKDWQKIELILHIHSFCTLRFNQPWIFEKRKVQKISKSKTWICHRLATIYITFTLYLQLFTQFLQYLQIKKEINRNIITFTLRGLTTPFIISNTSKLALSNKWIFIWSIWRITTISYYFIVFKYFLVAIGVFSILNFLRWLTQNLLKRKKKREHERLKGRVKD